MPVLYTVTYCKPGSKCMCTGVFSSLYLAQQSVVKKFKPATVPYPDCRSIYALPFEVCRFTKDDHTFIITEELLDRPMQQVV